MNFPSQTLAIQAVLRTEQAHWQALFDQLTQANAPFDQIDYARRQLARVNAELSDRPATNEQTWKVYWANDQDAPATLAVWPDKPIQDGQIGTLICKISPAVDVTKDDLANAALIASAPAMQRALDKLVFLHACEQEGLGSGQPSPTDWYPAVDEAAAALELSKTLPYLS